MTNKGLDMKEVRAVKREAIFIKKTSVSPEMRRKILDRYTFRFYEEKACANCEFKLERHSDLCDNCAAYSGTYELATSVKVGANRYIRVPAGDLPRFRTFMANNGYDLRVRSKAPDEKMKRKVKFLATLRDFQGPAINALIEHRRGILKSLPRSGKTVMASALVCQLGYKAIILASQRDWLMGFHETFVGSKTQAPMTDMHPSRIGFARTYEDFLKYDVCLCTVQTFWSEKGQALLARIRDMFPVIVIDEVHTSASPKYLMVMSRLNVRYAIGLSGTPSRKDQKMILSNHILGPIVHTTEVERLQPRVKLVRTKYKRQVKGNMQWPYMVGHLEKDKARQKLIAEHALRDMEAGHLVLIPYAQVKSIQSQIAIINKLAGRTVAYPFFGGIKKADRDLTIQRAREYKRKILVGNTKLLSTGINIPRASMLYDVSMSSNMENCEQRVSRVLTPFEGKPQPILKIFLDEMGVRKSCLRNEWFNCVRPKFKPLISDIDKTVLDAYFRAPAQSTIIDAYL